MFIISGAMRRYLRICFLFVFIGFLSGCAGIYPPANVKPIERVMLVTGYCKCGKCCGWRRTWYGKPVYASGSNMGKPKAIGITASGAPAGHGTIAADRAKYPFGTIMYVEGYGYGRVEDTGGDIKGDHIDLYFSSHSAAMRWGKKNMAVRIWMEGRKTATSVPTS